ncbi:DNA N-6-adenine-methyltransferase of bacteriophage [Clostridia bacterium]|nr:DNA N-6-adenine-methyltransferase of bacteriophage [Clostridia bacterium]
MMDKCLFTSNSGEWETPQAFFDKLDDEFHFDLDVCATAENAKVARYFTKEQDGLAQSWAGSVAWCNPPYGKGIELWCQKCYESSLNGVTVVLLVPVRSSTKWFHDWVLGKAELRFVRGCLHFSEAKHAAPFPSLVAVYRPTGHVPIGGG